MHVLQELSTRTLFKPLFNIYHCIEEEASGLCMMGLLPVLGTLADNSHDKLISRGVSTCSLYFAFPDLKDTDFYLVRHQIMQQTLLITWNTSTFKHVL